MVQLDPDRFLNELGKLYERTKAGGSVYITMKRTNMKPRKAKKPNPAAEYLCLIRATDGKKKISATLTPREQLKFQEAYTTIMRAHMDSLKKREKVKQKAKKGQDKQ